MNLLYNQCPCLSGLKFKFCCLEAIKSGNNEYLETRIGNYPVTCFGASNIQETGLGIAIVARKVFDDHYIFGYYLVDIWCLGVKDASFKMNNTQRELNEFLQKLSYAHPIKPYEYEAMRSLILGSVHYAAQLDIAPHADWNRAKYLIEPNRAFKNNVEFGCKGKPFYVAGPYDEGIMQNIIRKVEKVGGHWVVSADDLK